MKKLKHANVWITMTRRSETEGGEEHHGLEKDECDHEILGVCVPRMDSNDCAINYFKHELGHKIIEHNYILKGRKLWLE